METPFLACIQYAKCLWDRVSFRMCSPLWRRRRNPTIWPGTERLPNTVMRNMLLLAIFLAVRPSP